MKQSKAKGKEKVLLKSIQERIKRIDNSSDVILYGSRARGDFDSESDYDLLILSDKPVTLEKEDEIRRELYPIELDTGAVLTVTLISKKDWNSSLYAAMPFFQNIQREGVAL